MYMDVLHVSCMDKNSMRNKLLNVLIIQDFLKTVTILYACVQKKTRIARQHYIIFYGVHVHTESIVLKLFTCCRGMLSNI